MKNTIAIDGEKYRRVAKGTEEVMRIEAVVPFYSADENYLELRLKNLEGHIPVTKLKPGMKIRIIIENDD